MNRYLLHLSYIGTYFKGVCLIPPYYYFNDRSTVQGALESALKSLSHVNKIEVTTSSRTDARVHALQTTFLVGLEQKNETDPPYKASAITYALNKKFKYTNEGIRVIHTEIMDDPTFKPFQNIASRTYLYRIAVRKNTQPSKEVTDVNYYRPIEEENRCLYYGNENFDIERMKKIAPLFVGDHDFRTFMKPSKEEKAKQPSFARRKIHSLIIEPGKPCVTSYNLPICEQLYQYWNIRICAKSFVYRQVRRIVSTLIAAGAGEISEREVYEMLTIPSHKLWYDNEISTVPGYALYLVSVQYANVEDAAIEENQQLDKHPVEHKNG